MHSMMGKATGMKAFLAWHTCKLWQLKKQHLRCEALIMDRQSSQLAGNGPNQVWRNTTSSLHGFGCNAAGIPGLNGPDLGLGAGQAEADLGSQNHSQKSPIMLQAEHGSTTGSLQLTGPILQQAAAKKFE